MRPSRPEPPPETPLPATLRFVFSLGAILLVGWLLMFALLLHRWN